jgi:hypothetical protein
MAALKQLQGFFYLLGAQALGRSGDSVSFFSEAVS